MNLLALAIDQTQKPLVEHKPDPNKVVEPKKKLTDEERRIKHRAYAKRAYEKQKRLGTIERNKNNILT